MAATRIRIRLTSVEVIDDEDWIGAGEWYFTATATKLPGRQEQTFHEQTRFEANDGATLNIGWSTELDITPEDRHVEIRVSAKDEDLIWDDDLGWIRIRLVAPIVHDYDLRLESNLGKFVARVQVEILAQTDAATGPVTTIRGHFDASTYSTLHDGMVERLVQVSPVVPLPPPDRGDPPMPPGVVPLSEHRESNLGIDGSASKPNALVNPAVIPAISPSSPDFLDRCARLKVTRYRPADLDLSKLIWRAKTSNVAFWHNGGRVAEVRGVQEVNAYATLTGDADEPCAFEVRWDEEGEPLLTTFRAWAGRPKQILTRANIIKCSSARVGGIPIQNPRVTPDQVRAHLDFSNILLWQIGVELVMDTDTTCYNGASTTAHTGIFEVSSAQNHTFNVTKDRTIVAPLLNSRSGVFNLAYLHSCRGKPNLLGSATDRSLSEPEAMVSLSGTPSSSWVRPTGLWPDDASRTVRMKRMGKSNPRDASLGPLCGDGAINRICGCIVTDKARRRIAGGNVTLTHELCHVIGLHHRGSGGRQETASYDQVNHMAGPLAGHGHPWLENVMCYGSDRVRQDLDVIQAKVVRAHALVRPTRPSPPPSPPPPAPPPPAPSHPVPTAWTPTEDDVILMQQYLGGTRPGLTHSGYPLGSSGPRGDGVDGVYGSRTRAAVRSFQSDHGNGLEPDGIYGPNTRDAFDQELNGGAEDDE